MQSDNFRTPAQDTENFIRQATALATQQRFAEAIPLFESAAANLERVHGPGAPEMAECLQSLAECYEATERFYDSLRVNWQLLRIGEKVLGRAHPDIVSMLLRLAETNEMLGRHEEALQLVEQGLESAKQCLTPDHPLSVNLMEGYQYLTSVLRAQAQGHMPGPEQFPAPFAPAQPGQPPAPAYNNAPMPGAFAQPAVNQPAYQNYNQDFSQPMPGAFAQPNQNLAQGNANFSQQAPFGSVNPSSPAGAEAGQPSPMHDFAREMLKDMPGTGATMTPFSQSVNPNSTSGVSYAHIGQSQNYQSGDSQANISAGFMPVSERFALDPNSVPLPTPPERQPGEINRASFSNALSSQRPLGDELDEEPYTPEAIAQLTNREKKPAKQAARFTDDSALSIKVMRIGKELAVPIGALVVMIAMVLYLFGGQSHTTKKGAADHPAGSVGSATDTTGTGSATEGEAEQIVLQSADGKKTLKLLPPDQAYFITATGATLVPFNIVGNSWSDYFTVVKSALTERQLWYEKRPSTFRGEDGSVYYLKGSPEGKVLEKMHQLAGWAQSFYLRTGEYPKMIPEGGYGEFAYVNPFTGKGYNIIIRQIHTATSDASDVKKTLETGALMGNDATNVPGDVACYAAMLGDEKSGSNRCVKFFLRGCDVEGHHLASGEPGKVYVVTAGNEHLAKAMITVPTSADKNPKVGKTKSRVKARKAPKAAEVKAEKKPVETAVSADEAMIENAKAPEKSSRMLIVDNPTVSLTILHYILPILLLLLTVACFVRSQMQGFDIKGKTISQGSSLALNFAMGSFCLTLLVIIAQFVVFR